MSLLKINDSKETKSTEDQQTEDRELAIGIDLGTSNCVVSYINEKQELNIISIDGGSLVPSIVLYEDNRVIVGKKALQDHKSFKSIKRFMGRSLSDSSLQKYQIENYPIVAEKSDKTFCFFADNKYLTTEQIVADMLKYLKNQAEAYIKKPIQKAVITVPAYFDEAARQATKNAATLANLEVLRLINEPTAAALAYGLDENIEGKYLVYDFGGGTFDVSVLNFQRGIFRVMSTAGDINLGGDDIDYDIALSISNNLKSVSTNKKADIANFTTEDKDRLLGVARQVKEQAVVLKDIEDIVNINNERYKFSLTSQCLEEIFSKWVNKTLEICKRSLEDAKLDNQDILGIVLVGGSTKLPYIQNKVKEFFNKPILCSINPDEVVSVGAAYKAASFVGLNRSSHQQDALLLDIVPLSLGLEIGGGIVEKIIQRNSPIPIKKSQEFTTSKDGQTSMLIHILQGEREMVKDLRSLGRFSLKGIPPTIAGAAKVLVTFAVDADGLLTVEAEEKNTGIKQDIEIKPTWGLSIGDMRSMIEQSMIHAKEDITERLLLQSITEGELLLQKVEKSLLENAQLISKEEQENIILAVNKLSQALQNNNREVIEELIKTLTNITNDFAQKIMTNTIKEALEGKNVDDIKKIVEK